MARPPRAPSPEETRANTELTAAQAEHFRAQAAALRTPLRHNPALWTVFGSVLVGGAGYIATFRSKAYEDLLTLKEQQAESSRTELKELKPELEQRKKDLKDAEIQLDVAHENVKKVTKQFELERDRMLGELTSMRTERKALADDVMQKSAQLSALQQRFDLVYRPYRIASIQNFIFEIKRECVDARINGRSFDMAFKQGNVPPARAFEDLFPPIQPCFADVRSKAGELAALNSDDMSKLSSASERLSKRITELRAEAARVYNDKNYVSKIPAYARVNTEPEPFIHRAPADEPQRSEWIEAMRRTRVLETYNNVVDGPTKAIQNLWAAPPTK